MSSNTNTKEEIQLHCEMYVFLKTYFSVVESKFLSFPSF